MVFQQDLVLWNILNYLDKWPALSQILLDIAGNPKRIKPKMYPDNTNIVRLVLHLLYKNATNSTSYSEICKQTLCARRSFPSDARVTSQKLSLSSSCENMTCKLLWWYFQRRQYCWGSALLGMPATLAWLADTASIITLGFGCGGGGGGGGRLFFSGGNSTSSSDSSTCWPAAWSSRSTLTWQFCKSAARGQLGLPAKLTRRRTYQDGDFVVGVVQLNFTPSLAQFCLHV